MNEIRYWLRDDRPWEHELAEVDVLWHDANSAVGALYNVVGGTYVDELAVLVPNREMAANFIMRAVGEGRCTYFGTSDDTVHTEPLGTTYEVTYHFLSVPNRPFRLEVMHITGGHSPLHFVLGRSDLSGPSRFPIVHASFKSRSGDSEAAYDDARDLLWRNGYRPSQECESDYGLFGYWRKPGLPLFFLKPRLNLRDVAPPLPGLPAGEPLKVEWLPDNGTLPKRVAGKAIEDHGVSL